MVQSCWIIKKNLATAALALTAQDSTNLMNVQIRAKLNVATQVVDYRANWTAFKSKLEEQK